MMKKFYKILATALMVATIATFAVFAAACGEPQKAVSMTGMYGSGSYSFMSAYPGYTFKQVTTSVQTLTTYDDGTYVLTVTTKNLSGDLSFDPENKGDTATTGTNDRGQTVTNYYGTFTSTEAEGVLTVVLATPTAVTYIGSGNLTGGAGYYNTNAWTEAMAGEDALTAEAYLAKLAFAQTTVVIDTTTNGFTYLTLTPAATPAA